MKTKKQPTTARAFRCVILLTALLWTAGTLTAAGAETTLPEGLELSADTIEHALDTQLLTATGRVELRLGGLTAQGDRLLADLGKHLVHVRGPVTLKTKDGVLTGQNLDYYWDRHEGTVADARTVNRGLILASGEADIAPDGWLLKDSLFTKCDLPTPEYAFLAREVQVDPERQVAKARGVSLALFGHRVLPLPNMRFSLADTPVGRLSRERLPVPSTGYDSTRGFFVADEFPVHLSDRIIGLLGAGYGTLEGARLTAAGLYAPSPATTYRLDALYRQHAPASSASSPSQSPADLDGTFQVATSTRAGGLTLTLSEQDDPDRHNQDLAFLPRVALAPSSLQVAGLTLTPALEWARVREEASAHETTRSLGRLSWSVVPRLPGRLTLGLSGTASQAAYGTGDTLTAGTLSATLARPLTASLALETRYNYHQYAGATPFLFDAPDRFSEGEVGLAWRSGASALSASAVYNLAGWGTGSGAPPGGPVALKANASVASGPWAANADARYELGAAPHYSTLTLSLTRHLHCFDVSLAAEPLSNRFLLRVALR